MWSFGEYKKAKDFILRFLTDYETAVEKELVRLDSIGNVVEYVLVSENSDLKVRVADDGKWVLCSAVPTKIMSIQMGKENLEKYEKESYLLYHGISKHLDKMMCREDFFILEDYLEKKYGVSEREVDAVVRILILIQNTMKASLSLKSIREATEKVGEGNEQGIPNENDKGIEEA